MASKISGIVVCFLLTIISRAQNNIDLPKPGGEYSVGTSTFVLSDQTRPDSLSGGTIRKLLVQIWYPANVQASDKRSHYIFNLDTVFGKTLYDLYESIQTNSYENAIPQKGKYPVILFCTGRAVGAYAYSTLAEELASHSRRD